MKMVLQLNCSGCAFVCEKKWKCWRPKCFLYPPNSDDSSRNFPGQFCRGAQDLQVPAKLWRSARCAPSHGLWASSRPSSHCSPETPCFARWTFLGLPSALLKRWLVRIPFGGVTVPFPMVLRLMTCPLDGDADLHVGSVKPVEGKGLVPSGMLSWTSLEQSTNLWICCPGAKPSAAFCFSLLGYPAPHRNAIHFK